MNAYKTIVSIYFTLVSITFVVGLLYLCLRVRVTFPRLHPLKQNHLLSAFYKKSIRKWFFKTNLRNIVINAR